MFEAIQSKLAGAPKFLLCLLPERKNCEEKFFETENINKQFNDKYFFILLRRTFGKNNESRRRHLLTAYYDETVDTAYYESLKLKCKMITETTNEESTSKKHQLRNPNDESKDSSDQQSIIQATTF